MKIKTVNLEAGRPTWDRASETLSRELHVARQAGFTAIKIIHGYGSSGVGGRIKKGVLSSLRQRKQAGEIRAYVAGEDWRVGDEIAWDILNKCPLLKGDADLGRGNRGITVVLL